MTRCPGACRWLCCDGEGEGEDEEDKDDGVEMQSAKTEWDGVSDGTFFVLAVRRFKEAKVGSREQSKSPPKRLWCVSAA